MLMKSNKSRGADYSDSALMGGTVKGVADLMIKNDQFVRHYNAHSHSFNRTATAG